MDKVDFFEEEYGVTFFSEDIPDETEEATEEIIFNWEGGVFNGTE